MKTLEPPPEFDRVGQVQVIPFRREAEGWQVLMLKRHEEKGGFWQPVTGGIKPGEEVEAAATREFREETGLSEDGYTLYNTGYSFEFTDKHHGVLRTFTEHVVAMAVESPEGLDQEVELSREHVDHVWTDRDTAHSLIKYATGDAALDHYWPVVTGEPVTPAE